MSSSQDYSSFTPPDHRGRGLTTAVGSKRSRSHRRHPVSFIIIAAILMITAIIPGVSGSTQILGTDLSPSHRPLPASPTTEKGSLRRSETNASTLTDEQAASSMLPNLEPTYPPDEQFDWDLVIVVPTHISEFSRRCAVRDSWGRQLRGHEQGNRQGKRTVKLVFIIGAHAPDDRTRAMALAEERQFGDIHVLPSDFVDEYRSLATKTRLSMRDAVHNIGKFRLLLKTDTDSFVHLERLLAFIDKEGMWNDRRVYAGAFRTDVVEWRQEDKGSKWWDGDFKKMTGLERYPYNAKGAGYIVSYDLAKYLADPPLPLRRWTHEDVGVGSWLMAIDHRRVSMPISFMTPECGCGATCDEDTFYQDDDDDILRKEPVVIDHYVPEYLQRWRQRRYELIGDACWASSETSPEALPRDIIEVDDSHNEAFTTGMMGYTFVVCRGSDGNEYDEFECTASSLSGEAHNHNQAAAALETPLQLQDDWERLSETGSPSCGRLLASRDLMTLAECEELGRFYTNTSDTSPDGLSVIEQARVLSSPLDRDSLGDIVIAWTPSSSTRRSLGRCRVVDTSLCDGITSSDGESVTLPGDDSQIFVPSTQPLSPARSTWSLSRRKVRSTVSDVAPSRAISWHGMDPISDNWFWLLVIPLLCVALCACGFFMLRRFKLSGGRIARYRRDALTPPVVHFLEFPPVQFDLLFYLLAILSENNRAGLRSIKLVFTVGAHYPDDDTKNTALAEMKQFDSHQLWDGSEPIYAGAFETSNVVWNPRDKDNKWYDGDFAELTGIEKYPWHAKGAGYMLSYKLAKYLSDPPIPLRDWVHEDVGVGAWLMPVSWRRVDMPVRFMEPQCDCATSCSSTIFNRNGDSPDEIVVIDHYIPEYLHRWRQRRYELFHDSCWAPEAYNASHSPVDIEPSSRDKADYLSPFPMGFYKRDYYFEPLKSRIKPPLIPSHADTRSGVCAISFTPEETSSSEAISFRAKKQYSICRGSDGFVYDDFECDAAAVASQAGTGRSLDWRDRSSSSTCRSDRVPSLERFSLALDQCLQLATVVDTDGHGWTIWRRDSQLCQVYPSNACSMKASPSSNQLDSSRFALFQHTPEKSEKTA
ncbi:hypothetical protein FOL47_010572 [Perkinsus chesapeaki]|uniref:Uncharacterized protein n=1 Tax=Perkinsus chesapeaki TaxID=330153 RepID=A0A7J6MQB3_PERCH|nr:hypothetical protein FOL47_010572 [Perkinsus chesapeaki]